MTRAIYTAAKDGKVIAQRDALIWVRLTAPGMYAVCGELTERFTTCAVVPFCRGKKP